MKRAVIIATIFSLGLLMTAISSSAGQTPGTQIAQILDHKSTLNLTVSQVKKLEQVQRNTQARMAEAKSQSEIRLGEIERFTSNWQDMNSVAVLGLIKEYFKYLTDYKTAELESVIQARAILNMDQLNRFQQLVTIESLMLNMEDQLAQR